MTLIIKAETMRTSARGGWCKQVGVVWLDVSKVWRWLNTCSRCSALKRPPTAPTISSDVLLPRPNLHVC